MKVITTKSRFFFLDIMRVPYRKSLGFNTPINGNTRSRFRDISATRISDFKNI